MSMYKFFILSFTLSFFVFAQSDESANIDQEFQAVLAKISAAPEKDFQESYQDFDESLDQLLVKMKSICQGQYFTLIIDENGNERRKKLSLSRDEKKICFRDLEKLQIMRIESLYAYKTKYLNYLHENRLSQLNEDKIEAIDKIKNPRKRRSSSKRKGVGDRN